MSGRAGGRWLRDVTAQPLDKMLDTLALAGFDGIYIDRYGYADNGTAVIEGLSRHLRVQPIVSTDGRLVVFNMDRFRNALRRKYGDAKWRRRRKMVLRPLESQRAGGD